MSRPDLHINTGQEDEDVISSQDEYSDEGESSSASIDPDIDFDLNYALHTFVATVEGQASVVKGDSLVLLDDTNSYWWLVNVLKTEDVGYIPAENIETPYERLARLNKFRNVDIAAATQEEKNIGLATSRLQLRNVLSASKSPGSRSPSPTEELSPENGGRRGVKFSAPTYVEHPGNQGWSDDEEDEEDGEYEEGEYDEGDEGEQHMEGEELDEEEYRRRQDELENGGGSSDNHGSFAAMEPDDGMSWDDDAGQEDRQERHRLAGNGLTPSASFSSAESMDDPPIQDGPRARQAEVVDPQQSQDAQGITLGPESTMETAPRSSAQHQQQAELGRGAVPSQQQQQLARSASASSVQSKTSSVGDAPEPSLSSAFVPSSSREFLDPALETGETRRIHATPAVARTPPQSYALGEALSDAHTRNVSIGSMRSSGEAPDMGYERDNDRDEESASPNGERLKKQRREEEDKSKKKGVFGSLFRKKDKKDKGIRASTVISDTERDSYGGRSSEDESTIRSPSSTFQDSPPPGPGRSNSAASRVSTNSTDPRRSNSLSSVTSPGGTNISPHGLRLQEIDQKQQALYHQYLSSAVNTTPERAAHPSLSYGTQAAAAVAQSTASQRMRASVGQSSPRPGSLLVASGSSMANAGLAGGAAANLSVLRIFAGQGVESDSTFKTVLLKESTTTDELVKQAIQRFRLGTAESADDYVLIVKGVDGEEEVLGSEGHPLVVFNSLNQEDPNLIKTIRRSSAGSISSISSNLSLNPAIAKLGDWSDDSLVKLYISRRTDNLNPSASNTSSLSAGDFLSAEPLSPLIGATQSGRFTLQVVIRPEDLPEGMMFDPASEAIIPRSKRMSSQPTSPSFPPPASPSLSQTERLRYFLLPANTTVAEAIEVALERFGIAEGVVDGGDDVEDKLSKRKSLARVRYGLSVKASEGDERVLHPSTKLVDSYSSPPTYRTPPATDAKERRRSREIPTAHPEDVQPSDPVFIIRRAVPRGNNLSILSSPRRSRSSVLMDSSRSSVFSDRSARGLSAKASASSLGSERTAGPSGEDNTATITPAPSRQEIIAAQRAASRANQLAILSANTNASQGIDLVMSDRGTVRSSRLLMPATGDQQVRYSYIEPDGETTYDISELIEEEWTPTSAGAGAGGSGSLDIPRDERGGRAPSPSEGDVLEGALRDNNGRPISAGEGAGEIDQKIDRVLQKVRAGSVKPLPSPTTEPSNPMSRALATTAPPPSSSAGHRKQQSSITSSMSRSSPSTDSPSTSQQDQTTQPSTTPSNSNPTPPNLMGRFPTASRSGMGRDGRPMLVTRDDFGIKGMMAVIHARAREPVAVKGLTKRRDEVEEKVFGVKVAGPPGAGGRDALGTKFDEFDRELDRLLEGVWGMK